MIRARYKFEKSVLSVMDDCVEKQRHHRRALMIMGGVIGIVALAAGVYALTLGRSPLAGDRFYDFGYILIPAGESAPSAEHTFTLTNRTGQPLTIRNVRISCGCTAADYTTGVVQPGEQLEVKVTLNVTRNGLSEQQAFIETAERGVHTLTVRGIGKLQPQLRTNRPRLDLNHDGEEIVVVMVEVWPGDLADGVSEPLISIDAGDLLGARLVKMEKVRVGDRRAATPTIWAAHIGVSAAVRAYDSDRREAEVVVRMLDDELVIPVKLPAFPLGNLEGSAPGDH